MALSFQQLCQLFGTRQGAALRRLLKAQMNAGDRNVLGHTGQLRERYTRRRRLRSVK